MGIFRQGNGGFGISVPRSEGIDTDVTPTLNFDAEKTRRIGEGVRKLVASGEWDSIHAQILAEVANQRATEATTAQQ